MVIMNARAVNAFGIAVDQAQLTVNKVYIGSGGGVSMDEQGTNKKEFSFC